jgi:hypothetical protein
MASMTLMPISLIIAATMIEPSSFKNTRPTRPQHLQNKQNYPLADGRGQGLEQLMRCGADLIRAAPPFLSARLNVAVEKLHRFLPRIL